MEAALYVGRHDGQNWLEASWSSSSMGAKSAHTISDGMGDRWVGVCIRMGAQSFSIYSSFFSSDFIISVVVAAVRWTATHWTPDNTMRTRYTHTHTHSLGWIVSVMYRRDTNRGSVEALTATVDWMNLNAHRQWLFTHAAKPRILSMNDTLHTDSITVCGTRKYRFIMMMRRNVRSTAGRQNRSERCKSKPYGTKAWNWKIFAWNWGASRWPGLRRFFVVVFQTNNWNGTARATRATRQAGRQATSQSVRHSVDKRNNTSNQRVKNR